MGKGKVSLIRDKLVWGGGGGIWISEGVGEGGSITNQGYVSVCGGGIGDK